MTTKTKRENRSKQRRSGHPNTHTAGATDQRLQRWLPN